MNRKKIKSSKKYTTSFNHHLNLILNNKLQ